VLRTGIITSYLSLRYLVRSGLLDIYPTQTCPARIYELVNGVVHHRPITRLTIHVGLGPRGFGVVFLQQLKDFRC
jgi:hypothetical protein